MKKEISQRIIRISIILTLLIVILFISPLISIHAANPVGMNITHSDADGYIAPGETVTVTVFLTDYDETSDPITALQVSVPLDTSMVEYVSCSVVATTHPGDIITAGYNRVTKQVEFIYASNSYDDMGEYMPLPTSNTTLFELTIRTLENLETDIILTLIAGMYGDAVGSCSATLNILASLPYITLNALAPTESPYEGDVTIAWNKGEGTMTKDGGTAVPITSGHLVSSKGDYIVAVTDRVGNTKTVSFSVRPNSGIITGWIEEAGEWYYYDETGEKVTGWYTDSEDNKYYLDDETGARQHGWYLSEAGDWYYFHPDSGCMCTDWLLDSGRWYFLNRSTGVMQTGWLLDSGRWYFLNRSSGIMQTGWLLDSGRWYFLNRSSGIMQTSWLLDNGRWYFFNRSSGIMQTSWLLDSGRWFFFDRSSGIMQTGWLLDSGKWYFFNRSSGIMQTGWLLDSGRWFFFDRNSGVMQTGWLLDSGRWFFFDRSSGVMQTGWVLDDGKWYYFDSNGVYIRTG